MGKSIFILLASLLLFGCENHSNTSARTGSKIKKKIQKIDSLFIPIGSDDYYASSLNYLGDATTMNDSLLYRGANGPQSIDIYNLKTQKLYKKIPIESAGANRVTNFQGFYFPVTEDSIVFPVTIGRISIMKDREIVLKNYFENYSDLYIFFVKSACPLIKHNDDVVVCAIPDIQKFDRPEYFLNKRIAKYSLAKDTLRPLDINYPDFYKEKCWQPKQYYITYTNKGNYLYVLFGAGGDIICFDLDKEQVVKNIKVPDSKFVDWRIPKPSHKCGEYSSPSSLIQDAEKPIHSVLKYDHYKDVFYLMTYLPVKDIEKDRKDILKHYNAPKFKPISLMVLDNEFQLIDEIELPGRHYDLYDFFVTKDGLYISTNNEFNENFNEDALRFDLFDLL